MNKTNHYTRRQSQRGLRDALVNVVLNYGVSQTSYGAERNWMSRESMREVIADEPWLGPQDIDELKKYVVINNGADLITAYKRD